MRIVITMLHYYPDSPSGSARLAYDEALFLANLGHEVWVVTQDQERNKPDYSFQNDLHVLRYPSPRLSSFDPRRMWAHQLHTRTLLSRFIRQPVDLVHGHSLLNYDGAISLYDEKVRKCYSVHSPVRLEMKANCRGSSLLNCFRYALAGNLSHYIEHRCLNRSDVVTVFSDYTRSLLHNLHGEYMRQKSRVIPGWVDLSRFCVVPDRLAIKSQFCWPIDVPVFFTLRRLVPRMGLDVLLRALRVAAEAGYEFHFMIGGSGPQKEYLQKLAAELDLQSRVSFLGRVSDDLLPQMYAAADAFLLPTADLECFGLIALEALACGRPVLATPVGAIPEVVGKVEPRWLAKNSDMEALVALVIDFLKGSLPEHNPDALHHYVAQRYSQDELLTRLVNLALGVVVNN